jgi:drug/metabolite transporter (DMT)-like permease
VSAKQFGVLLLLGAVWGASFMFIKVGGKEMQPFALVELRLGLAALTLLLISAPRPAILRAMLHSWRPLAVMGLINCALPYTLITWGEEYVSSGLAAIYNACAPLWAAGIGLVLPSAERLSPARMVGLLLGMAGVIMVVSTSLSAGEEGVLHIVGQGACLVAALSYGIAGIYGRKALRGVPSQAAATGQLVTSALMVLPLAAMQVPDRVPSGLALGAVATLAIAGTALASLLYYWLLSRVGATKVLLVTYLLPGFALMWGALFLSEPITLTAVAGLVLILLGIAVTSGSGPGLVGRFLGKAGKMPA